MEKKGNSYLCLKSGVKMLFRCELLSFALFPPLPFSVSQIRVRIPRPRPGIAFFPRVNSAVSRRGGVGGGLGSPLAGFSPNTEIRFFDDFSIFT